MSRIAEKSVARRKAAQQERSRAKVQLILDTTLALLNEGPADRITTNGIAKRAGISVGSLYQFFPKKEAIFYQLFSQWLQQTLDLLDEIGERVDSDCSLPDLVDAVFESQSKDDSINSPGHWQLLRAMGSTKELVELETRHQQEVFNRLIAFQEKLGRKIPPQQAMMLATLQHHVMVGCLATVAQVGAHEERERLLKWCRETMRLVYDIDRLNA